MLTRNTGLVSRDELRLLPSRYSTHCWSNSHRIHIGIPVCTERRLPILTLVQGGLQLRSSLNLFEASRSKFHHEISRMRIL
jgi:hypothetical protein